MEKRKELGKKALTTLILMVASPTVVQGNSFNHDGAGSTAMLSAQFDYPAQFGYPQSGGGADNRDDGDDDDGDDDDRSKGDLSDNYSTPLNSYNRQQPNSSRNDQNGNQNNRENSNNQMQNRSSYQGTTTSAGPNDGYPATPSGVYSTESGR